MSNKISGYTAIAGVQADDVLPVVDVHDTSMAATGTTKKITLAQVAAVAASAYAPGGLTGATAASRYAGGTTSGAPVSGTFATGDFVIDQSGKVWICTVAGTPGTWAQAGAALDGTAADIKPLGVQAAGVIGKGADAGHVHPYEPWQFYVASYGAAGDGTTDDTAAVKSALAAAYAYAVANTGYYELIFDPKTYLIAGATSTGTLGIAGKCKAQIPLHVTATTAQKVTGVWRGTRDASALYHWQQTAVQQSGTVLKTTLNASAQFSVTGTEPSVVGGGIPVNGYGSAASTFGNDLIVVDGITIQTPNDPHICGFDFRGLAQANVISGSTMVNAGGGLIGSITAPTQAWQFGLAMPQTNNNDNCNVQMWSAEGQNYGIVGSEHTVIWSMRSIYCIAGLALAGGSGSSTPHGLLVHYASVEACQIGLQLNYDTASVKLRVIELDWESGSGSFAAFNVIQDPASNGLGEIGVVNIGAATPRTATFVGGGVMNGGAGLRIRALDLPLGHITPPSVPSSATALTNGSGADAAVTVTGGTVTVITVDGTATGLTSGTVVVPGGKTIAVTYSVAPSWNWVLF